MRQGRFSEEQMVGILREADREPVAQVIEAMGIPQPAVAKIEAGKVKSLDTLKRYASAVGCKVRLELVSS